MREDGMGNLLTPPALDVKQARFDRCVPSR